MPPEDAAGDPPRSAPRLTLPRVMLAVVMVALVAVLAAGALAGRDSRGAQVAVVATPPQSELTIVPQLTPTAPIQPGPTATPIPLALRKEIEDAYDRFWRVRADAALSLDGSRLPEVAAGVALEIERRNVEQLRAQGRAGRYIVDLQYGVVEANQTSAVVATKYQDRSYVIDVQTRNPIAPTPFAGEEVKMTYWLEKIDGNWKVVDGTVHQV